MPLFRDNIGALAGYTPGEQPQTTDYVKLNTNESPYPPSPKVIEAIVSAATDRLRLYPDPLATHFRRTAAEVFNVDPDGVVACNGSDDALTILARATLGTEDLLVSPTPSYPLYIVLAQIQGCRFEHRPFTPTWELPDDFAAGSKLALIANPNSPTGTMLPPTRVLQLAQNAPGLLVADEAYVDFADDSCLPLVSQCDRLVVCRTLSKSYGLAGLRFGFVIAQPAVARTLIKVKDSYNCDTLSIAAAAAAIADQEYMKSCIAKVRVIRSRMERQLADLGFEVTPSHANFVWIRRSAPVKPIYEGLKAKKILIRHLFFPGYGEGLRISVGTEDQIDRLFDEMRTLV